jgi:hypothetical protein
VLLVIFIHLSHWHSTRVLLLSTDPFHYTVFGVRPLFYSPQPRHLLVLQLPLDSSLPTFVIPLRLRFVVVVVIVVFAYPVFKPFTPFVVPCPDEAV